MPGVVFGIHRMALDDGPGIRTAVFLKGCMLHCPWCHNPESQKWEPELLVRQDKCKMCGMCNQVCPVNILENGAKGFERSKCKGCNLCAQVCKHGALSAAGEQKTAEEVMEVVMRDANHYQYTGGGLTLTGGDPLCQADFAYEILSMAKNNGVHTCLETSGVGEKNAVEKLFPLVDLWLFDIKGTPEIYRDMVGINFEVVENSLHYLLRNEAKVVLRCPIITGVTDSDEWILSLCKFICEKSKIYPIQDVHLLPYHRLGLDKYEALHRESKMKSTCPPKEEHMKRWNVMIGKEINQTKG